MRRWIVGLSACIGLALIGVPILWLMASAMAPTPGQLVADKDTLIWQAPQSDSPASRARATFRVVNTGDSLVHIRSVRSGCDCAIPRVEPKVVSPGGSAIVEVEPELPVFGQKTVAITLLTDSLTKPELNLQLKIQGKTKERRAYLYRADGDLSYVGEWTPEEEPRQIIATTIQPPGEQKPPEITSDLPFLGFELVDTDKKISTDPSILFCNYTFNVIFTSDPPRGPFGGEVAVVDPWDETHRQRIRVYGETPAPMRAIPARLILQVGPPKAEVTLRVRCRDRRSMPSVELENPEANPLEVRPLPHDADRSTSFLVGLKAPAETVEKGVYNLIVRPSPSSSERLLVPVMVRKGEGS